MLFRSDGETRLAALDLCYALSPAWNVSAWASLSDVRLDQASNGDGTDVNGAAVNDQDWAADLRQFGRAVGVALRGRLADTHDMTVISPSRRRNRGARAFQVRDAARTRDRSAPAAFLRPGERHIQVAG